MNKHIILHVGMHKTGTTFLQQDVFPYIPGVYYAKNDIIKDSLLQMLKTPPTPEVLAEEKAKIYAYMETLSEPTILISYEGLFGYYQRSYKNNPVVTAMLHELFPQARIFIAFRRQDEWLESLYHQTMHMGRSYHVNRFLNYKRGKFEPYAPEMSAKGTVDVRVNAYPFVKNYQEVFGKDNVLTLPYEFFKQDMPAFLDRFFQFYGLEPFYPEKTRPINRSFSLISCYIALALNPFITKKEHQDAFKGFLKGHLDKMIYIPAKFINEKKRRQILELHQEENRKLSQLIGMDLAQYGYY